MSALEQLAMPDFAAARLNMIEGQVRPNKVTDGRILDAMGSLPRKSFVTPLLAGIAYKDQDLQVGSGRYLMEPMILARLLQEAGIKSTDRVMDIGPATGYSTAVIASMTKEVLGIESDPGLVTLAVKNLAGLAVGNVEFQLAPMKGGWPHKGPYDVILINGSVEFVPEELFGQLADGGRLMAVVLQYGPAQVTRIGEARLYEKIHGAVSHRALFDANIKPLPGFQAAAKFTFE